MYNFTFVIFTFRKSKYCPKGRSTVIHHVCDPHRNPSDVSVSLFEIATKIHKVVIIYVARVLHVMILSDGSQ